MPILNSEKLIIALKKLNEFLVNPDEDFKNLMYSASNKNAWFNLEEVEKAYILEILHLCKGKISGPGGAAELLNIPSTTLNSKIKKLGISYEFTD